MQRKSQAEIWTTCFLIVGLAGCVKQPSEPSDAGPTADAGDMSVDPNAGSGGSNAGSSGDSSGAGGDATSDGGASAMPEPDFEGIPVDAIVYGTAPDNCTAKGTNEADTLVLPLTTKVKALLISSQDGHLQVNGVTCTGVANPKAIKVTGTATAETVIVDFSLGDLPDSMHGGSISVDLGTGGAKDTFALAVTRGDDEVHLGALNAVSQIKVGTVLPLLKISNQENLIVSTGPGRDIIDATGDSTVGTALSAALIAFGGADDDALQGGAGADTLHGGDGDDSFKTAAAADGGDIYDGGPGLDSLSYEARTKPLTIKVDKMANDGETNEKDDVQATIETLIGGAGADNITMGDSDDTIVGGPGNDILNGGAGDDTFLETGTQQGADVMNGGPGSDTIDYSERPTDLQVTLCIPAQATCAVGLCGCAGDDGEANEKDGLVNIENVNGGRGNDLIIGSAADNLLMGNEGNDDLRGDSGDDTIYAGDGNDKLSGGAGDDLLSGDNGADTYDGGDGQGDICIVSATESPLNCELH